MSLELISLDQIQEIAHQYGYWAIFAGILIENTGIPIPGETITLVGGFLAGSGELDYWAVLGTAIVGAVLGDSFGYWIGYYGGWPLLTRVGQLFRMQESQLIGLRQRFAENAAKAVFLGRFIALLRIFAGPLAGIARMPYLKFLLCNLAGATLWASVMVSLSYFVGRLVPLEQLIGWAAQFAFLALGLMMAWIGLSYWLEQRSALPIEQQD
ncbi:MAG: DedA family protein [Pegethrix bostrychoides GSE-TBD4-15B]|jgi:membrane protein DedA with SNARE-associated domain|uniref:DedA family protein n=1 Tax=Pegethrix bostrychoides GSE-TBD4-15B TaxID=2839662 RepID=A0A951PCP6_9CYAN|nr:DedA family protein [Pegethrix bostrychoides GSE-TBD4-15B]